MKRVNFKKFITASFNDKTFIFFVCLGLAARISFWAYTNRTLEDALIAVAHVKNYWLGNGLTHHISEPRVQGFSSPLAVLLALPWESVGWGLASIKVYSLAAYLATLAAAKNIFDQSKTSQFCRLVGYSFLACDQSQIFFGMAGMETQVAVATLVLAYSFLIKGRWIQYGWLLGLGLITRPDYVIYMAIGYISYIWIHKKISIQFAVATLALPTSWATFSILYFGSPLPNTIVAKSLIHPPYTFANGLKTLLGYWSSFSPYWANYFTISAPIPSFCAFSIVIIAFALAIYAAIFKCTQGKYIYTIPITGVLIYVGYLGFFQVSKYFLWYVPPVSAVVFIYCSIGFDAIASRKIFPDLFLKSLIIVISIAYASHIPNSFALEKQFQEKVEHTRSEVGKYINRSTTAKNTIVLEPLGYAGINAFNKTIYDFPGLASKVSIETLKMLPNSSRNFPNFINAIKPDYIALRPHEATAFKTAHPATSSEYELIRIIKGDVGKKLTSGRLVYYQEDSEFHIFRKKTVSQALH